MIFRTKKMIIFLIPKICFYMQWKKLEQNTVKMQLHSIPFSSFQTCS